MSGKERLTVGNMTVEKKKIQNNNNNKLFACGFFFLDSKDLFVRQATNEQVQAVKAIVQTVPKNDVIMTNDDVIFEEDLDQQNFYSSSLF